MLLIAITVALTFVAGLVTWLVARARRADPGAPSIEPTELRTTARRRLVLSLAARLDAEEATGAALAAAGVIVVAVTVFVGLLLVMIHTNTGLARLDHRASQFGAQHATSASTRFLNDLSQFGGAVVLVPLGLVIAAIEAYRLRSLTVVWFLVVAVGGQFLVANLTKWAVHRARPTVDQLTGFSGSSFPSGHAVAASACFAAFALVIGRRRSLATKRVLFAVAVGLAVGIAVTRVWLGVHWLTDVVAGLAMGWAWFGLCSIAFGGRRLRFGAPAAAAVGAVPPALQTPAPSRTEADADAEHAGRASRRTGRQ